MCEAMMFVGKICEGVMCEAVMHEGVICVD